MLGEIEHEAYVNPPNVDESNSTVLIMCNDQQTCRQLREYLATMHAGPDSEEICHTDDSDNSGESKSSAEVMMRRRLREYLDWKSSLSNVNKNLSYTPASDNARRGQGQDSHGAQSQHHGRAPPNKRRRVRGGGTTSLAAGRVPNSTVQNEVELPQQMSCLLEEIQPTKTEEAQKEEVISDDLEEAEDFYELYDMNDLVMIHPYDGDMDEHILEEVRPRYIIMYEPDPAFIRRVEVYRSSHVGRNVRVYFVYYGGSVEEQRYLSSVRREKDSFTKLIKEKGVRLPPNTNRQGVILTR